MDYKVYIAPLRCTFILPRLSVASAVGSSRYFNFVVAPYRLLEVQIEQGDEVVKRYPLVLNLLPYLYS